MYDFDHLMRYTRACQEYRGGHDSSAILSDIRALGEACWQHGLVLLGYDATLTWLYNQFTPAQLAPIYFECVRNPTILQDGKDILRNAILLITKSPHQAAMSLPEAKWMIDGFQVGAIYPDKFFVSIGNYAAGTACFSWQRKPRIFSFLI